MLETLDEHAEQMAFGEECLAEQLAQVKGQLLESPADWSF